MPYEMAKPGGMKGKKKEKGPVGKRLLLWAVFFLEKGRGLEKRQWCRNRFNLGCSWRGGGGQEGKKKKKGMSP